MKATSCRQPPVQPSPVAQQNMACQTGRTICDYGLSNYVGHEVTFQHGNLVAQFQFTLFQTGDLQLIGAAGSGQRIDSGIKIAMIDAQHFQPFAHLSFSHV